MATVSISNWDYKKPLNGDSAATSPGQGKAQAFVLDGSLSESNTGNSKVGYDASKIDTTDNASKRQSIVVTDSDESTTLPYEIENEEDLGTTNEVVVWVYKSSWAQDGTTEIVIGIGSGDGTDYSQEGTGNNAWNNTGQSAELVYHLDESSGQTIDSTPNNNDSTSTTGTIFENTEAPFGEGREADGDDLIQTPINWSNFSSAFTVVAYIDFNGADNEMIMGSFDGTVEYGFEVNSNSIELRTNDTGGGGQIVANGGTINTNTDYQVYGSFTSSNGYKVGIDGTQVASNSDTTFPSNTDNEAVIGRSDGNRFVDGTIGDIRFYSEEKTSSWYSADYEMSSVAGYVFFDVQAGEATTAGGETVALPESTGTAVTLEPQVNAGEATVNLPETTALAQSPEPVLFTDLFASMPVSTSNAASPNPTFAAGEATINLPESVGTAVSPNPSLFQANLIRAPPSVGTAVSPEPVIKGGLEEIALPTSTGTGTNPEPTIQFAQNLNLVASSGNAASPAPTFNTGPTTISLPESTGTGFTPNPSVAVSVVPRDDSNTLSIRQSQSKTLSGDINK